MKVNVGNLPYWQGVKSSPGYTTLPFTFCVRNGLIQTDLDPAELDRVTSEYRDDEYSYRSSPPGTSAWGNQRGNMHFRWLKNQVKDLCGKSVLDIGAGTYYMASRLTGELKAERHTVCDPSLRAEPEWENVELINDYFSYDRFKDSSYDLTLAICILEHVPDPTAFLGEVQQLLAPNRGQLFVVVPDCSRALSTGDIGVCVHEHLTYFTPDSLRQLFIRTGFEVEWLSSQQDTLAVLARGTGAAKPDLSDEQPLDELLGRFDSKLTKNLERARRLIEERRQDGPLAIHGCHVGLSNILHRINLKDSSHITLFDGDTNKTGKYIPNFDHPIHHPEDPLYQQMQSVLIAAVTYYHDIKSYLEKARGFRPHRIEALMPVKDAA